MSLQTVYAHKTIGITDLKRDSNFLEHLNEPVAILKRDSIKAYLVPEKIMVKIMEYLEDSELSKMVKERIRNEWEDAVEVDINEL